MASQQEGSSGINPIEDELAVAPGPLDPAIRHFDRLEVERSLPTKVGFREVWIALILLQLALIGGAVAVTGHVPALQHWESVFIALGALCLGFGLALLLNNYLIGRQANALQTDYLALKDQADLLVAKAALLNRAQSHASPAAAVVGTAELHPYP